MVAVMQPGGTAESRRRAEAVDRIRRSALANAATGKAASRGAGSGGGGIVGGRRKSR
jgi:hypothetical protein